jgi:metal-responsive CopG/Arc/MetJ family transcriptional regulator|tara:strand:- start:92 stop:232 length:141 start_codon:yes stop_codon:yes gene_type:complete
MSRHVSVVMPDDLFAKMEAARGRESKSSFVNFVLEQYFKEKKEREG